MFQMFQRGGAATVDRTGRSRARREGSGSKAQLLELRLSDSEDRRLLLAPMIGGGGPGGDSHHTENKSECYKSTAFPRVTQQVSSSFVSHVSCY